MIWYQAGMVHVCHNYPKLLWLMFVVNLKKSFKVIVEPEKIEQDKPDRQMY